MELSYEEGKLDYFKDTVVGVWGEWGSFKNKTRYQQVPELTRVALAEPPLVWDPRVSKQDGHFLCQPPPPPPSRIGKLGQEQCLQLEALH